MVPLICVAYNPRHALLVRIIQKLGLANQALSVMAALRRCAQESRPMPVECRAEALLMGAVHRKWGIRCVGGCGSENLLLFQYDTDGSKKVFLFCMCICSLGL